MTTSILLIEDNPMDALAVREAFQDAGGAFTVDTATALAPGIRKALAAPYEATLLDLGLPDSRGLDTLRAFRDEAKEVPVVVLTGAEDERVGLEALRLGAQDYLVKGRDTALLPRSVRYAIERHRAQAALDEAARKGEQQQRIASLGTLVAGVAHEINNPLTYVRGNVELSQMSLADLAEAGTAQDREAHLREARRLLGSVLAGIDRIAILTQSLRRLARPSHGTRAPTDVNAVVRSVASLVAGQGERDVRIEVETGPVPPVLADEAEITQVVLNLALNAVQAVGARGLVRLRTESARGSVRIRVSDDGPGIAPEDRARLFTPFFTTKPEGTGLGLSLSRRIVEDHGGTLALVDEGPGATFLVEIPAGGRARGPA